MPNLTADDYQQQAARTLLAKPDFKITQAELQLVDDALCLSATAGTVAERVKKSVFHRQGEGPLLWLDDELDTVRQLADGFGNGAANFSVPLTFPPNDQAVMLLWGLIGLVGEVAEVTGLALWHAEEGRLLNQDTITAYLRGHLQKELGDVAWYLAAVCTTLGLSLGDVMQANLDKLRLRFPDGWDAAASAQKRDEIPLDRLDPKPGGTP